jgi:hypothetical protein
MFLAVVEKSFPINERIPEHKMIELCVIAEALCGHQSTESQAYKVYLLVGFLLYEIYQGVT